MCSSLRSENLKPSSWIYELVIVFVTPPGIMMHTLTENISGVHDYSHPHPGSLMFSCGNNMFTSHALAPGKEDLRLVGDHFYLWTRTKFSVPIKEQPWISVKTDSFVKPMSFRDILINLLTFDSKLNLEWVQKNMAS